MYRHGCVGSGICDGSGSGDEQAGSGHSIATGDTVPQRENVRLEFRVAASNEPGLLVVTASPHYEAAVHFKGKDGEMGAEVSGEVRLDDRGIWVTYRLHLVTGGEGAVADYQIASSALLQPGQGMEIGNIGDKTVFLRASIVQGKSPAAAKKQPSE